MGKDASRMNGEEEYILGELPRGRVRVTVHHLCFPAPERLWYGIWGFRESSEAAGHVESRASSRRVADGMLSFSVGSRLIGLVQATRSTQAGPGGEKVEQ